MASPDIVQSSANTLIAISTPLEPTLDIVAVHGMNVGGSISHAENTWTDDNTKVNWLRSLLPQRLPFARILAFQYNANVVFGTSIAGVEQQAYNLLGCLNLKRRTNPARPIIFICHSLGGIIVKETLAIAFREHRAYPMIWTFTYGIFFLAVPHQGSSHAEWEELLKNILLLYKSGNSFLESVTPQSKYNKSLNARFEPLLEAYKFYTWIEGLGLGYHGIIVPEDSAKIGLPPSRETWRVANRDHRTICKFSGDNDREWIELSATLVEAAHSAVNFFNYTPTMRHRQVILAPHEPEEMVKQHFTLLEATENGQQMITTVEHFRTGNDYRSKFEEAEKARKNNWTLGTMIMAMLTPILNFLSSPTLNVMLANIALAAIVAVLPSRENALQMAEKGKEDEEKIMKVETWAIERLNEHLCEVLRASHILRCAINLRELEEQSDMSIMQLNHARYLQLRLLQQTNFIVGDLHERHESYNGAKYICDGVERWREEVTHKTKQELWILTAQTVKKEKDAAQAEDPKTTGGRTNICENCNPCGVM